MSDGYAQLDKLLIYYVDDPVMQSLRTRLYQTGKDCSALLAIYNEAIPLLEKKLWNDGLDDIALESYQLLFQEMERHIAEQGEDDRYYFCIVIPVADRPQHLKACLDSLLQLCRLYVYGGHDGDHYTRIKVVVADDSADLENIHQHQLLARHFNEQGLEVIYFGIDEQLQQIDRLTVEQRQQLSPIIGDIDREAFYHKGASTMRNITYLRLQDLSKTHEKILCYFIDSDQQFKVKVEGLDGERDIYAINYFYYLNQIFSKTSAIILTGKVVGDPPVSPSVMAANFLDDVIAFLSRMSDYQANQGCQFHTGKMSVIEDAAYHDMADLFGFKKGHAIYDYHCSIEHQHDNKACFIEFSNKLNHFFDGAHPTRKSYYRHEDLLENIKPARTIYTGNYIFRPTALRYFIPFAALKLRMAGPVLGRIIKAEIAEGFVSANLPMLHTRTVQEIGQSEFRPGINRGHDVVDLSGEFERQFFGDVMLFTMEALTTQGYPDKVMPRQQIEQVLQRVESDMYHKYQIKHQQIIKKMAAAKSLLLDEGCWWNNDPGLDSAKMSFDQFLNNMEYNFGESSPAYMLIEDEANKTQRHEAILDVIMGYTDDRCAWQDMLVDNA